MSQEKVDRYKEQKKNRKAIQAKKKRKALIEKICAGVIVLALVCWIVTEENTDKHRKTD